jgi:hypothetical protein
MINLKKSTLSLILMISINVCFAQNLTVSLVSDTTNQIPIINAGDTIEILVTLPVDTIYINNFHAWSDALGIFSYNVLYKLNKDNYPTNWNYNYTTDNFPGFVIDDYNAHRYDIYSDNGAVIHFYVKGVTSLVDTTGNDTTNTTTGIKNSKPVKSNIVAYPNPVTDNLIVSFNATNHTLNVDILDLQGRLVLSNTSEREVGQNTLKLDVSALKTGIYFVKINNRSHRFIKSK